MEQNICKKEISSLDFKPHNFYLNKINMYNFELDSDSPIFIDSDTDFISFGFPGNGSEENPYLIQNLDIDTLTNFGLVIVNTTKSFVVQNCNISAIVTSIHLQNNTGILTKVYHNNLFNGDYYGVYSFMCPDIEIINNTCYNNEAGIGVFFSENELISKNYCYENEIGILTKFSNNLSIINNICDNNTYNIDCGFSTYLNISDNYCSNNVDGIGCTAIYNSVISNNTIKYTGIGLYLHDCNNDIFTDNYLEYNDIGILHDNGYGTNFTGNKCLEGTRGIYIRDCHSTLVQENVCNKNSQDGIYIFKGTSAIIVNNTCNDNLVNGIYDSYWGMYIAEPHEIRGNICNNNRNGIQLYETDRIDVFNNTCSGNFRGIVLTDSASTEIVFNVLQNNIEYGVSLLDIFSTNNKIHHNDFINNNRKGTEFGKFQGYDYGFNNEWYDKHKDEGNYWDNLRNKKEYSLDGPRNAIDPYPLNNPVNNDIPYRTSFNFSISVITLILFTFYLFSSFRKKRKHLT